MKLSDIILKEELNVSRNKLNQLALNIGFEEFAKTILMLKDENILDDIVDAMNFSKDDKTSYYNPDVLREENRYNEDGYDEGDIKLMGDMILPTGKMVVLQAEEDTYNRGLLVTSNEDKSYDVAYWADDKTKPYPIGIEIDGKEVAKDANIIKFLFHPEMKNESTSLSEPNDEMEKVIDSGIKINGDLDNIKDVMYYVHNNWMGNEISAEEAMKKISKYIS